VLVYPSRLMLVKAQAADEADLNRLLKKKWRR